MKLLVSENFPFRGTHLLKAYMHQNSSITWSGNADPQTSIGPQTSSFPSLEL